MRHMTRRRTLATWTLLVVVLLGGCSASGSSSSDSAEGTVPQAGSGEQAGSDKGAPAAAADGADLTVGTSADTADGRQVITTGDVQLTVSDPRAAADAVVTLVESAGGRVDARTEQAETDEQDAHAQLTVRIPSDDLTSTLDALDNVGDVVSVNLSAQDVTGDAQDLDARIKALQISVSRMEDLLSRAATNADLISAEGALSERQANLESLMSQRARLAEQVALSTLQIDLSAPGAVPAAASPHGFWDGTVVGWRSLVAMLRVVVLVLGVLLPWLALGGLVTLGALAVRRAVRARRSAAPTSRGGSAPGGPGPSGPATSGPAPDSTGPHAPAPSILG